jgi:ATP-dependent Clp protease ATP-binding subunit ClpA
LESAQGLAEATDFPRIHAAHLLLALLRETGGYLDAKLTVRFNGLKAATIAESLQEILELEAPGDDEESQAGDLFVVPCGASAAKVLAMAGELAHQWRNEKISLAALSCALLDPADSYSLLAFGDAGLGQKELGELAASLTVDPDGIIEKKLPVFDGDRICIDSFGRLACQALQALTQRGEGRLLLAEDFLIAFLSLEGSRTLEALHVMGLNPKSILGALTQRYGESKGGKPGVLERSRLGRLLSGILEQAGELAQKEASEAIGESHLMRTYIARVASSTGSLLERLGINPVRLAEYLEKYKADREPAAPEGSFAMVQDVAGYLSQRVVAQEEAIRVVVPAMQRMRLGMNEPGRPLGVFLFLGATGVGKTELAKAVADIAFGPKPGVPEPYLIRIDCGKLTTEWDIKQLVGAPQGLVGYKEGTLTNGLRDKGSRCIVLFDEAEKAHPKVWQSLLTFFDEGIVTEADGTRYDATGCILVATSNLGYSDAIEKFRLYDRSAEELAQLRPKLDEFIWKRVTEYFSPEFRGRFGRENVLFFNHFTRAAYRQMLERQSQKAIDEMGEKGITVTVDAAALDALTDLAWDNRAEGARPVHRLITKFVRNLVVNMRAGNPACDRVEVNYSGELARAHAARQAARKAHSPDDIETYLNGRVINQAEAVRLLTPAIKRMRSGMNEPGRLIGSFLFLGPSGVGKTELAKAIAGAAFGAKAGTGDSCLIRIDCGKLTEARDIVQLLGAPQGLVGYKEGTLTNGLREKGGRCVIVFDEVEKANPHIWQSLLTFFDEGIVTEADGTRHDATCCILVATSNLGFAEAITAFRLFDIAPEDAQALRPQVVEFVWNKVASYFSPEFLGRFGKENVVLFNHFARSDYRTILVSQVASLTAEMEGRGLECSVDDPVLDKLVELAWVRRSEGARTVRRLITGYLRDQIVDGRESDPDRTVFHFCIGNDGEIAALDR